MSTLVAAALVAAGGCGDDDGFQTASFRLVGPPPPTADNRCPELFEPTAPTLAGADRVRLTYRREGGGALLCDAVLPTAGGNRVVAVPELAETGGRVDLFVEIFGDLGAGPVLLGRGQTLGVQLSSTSSIDIEVTPSNQFSCSHTQPVVARAFHTVTALPGGELLIAGGVTAPPASGDDVVDPVTGQLFAIGELEVYDPVAGESLRLSAPVTPRAMHSAVLLTTDPVRVALIGGLTVSGDPEALPVLRRGADNEAFRLMPGAAAVPAPTEIITYDPVRRTATAELVDEVVTRGIMSASFPDGPLAPGSRPIIAGGWADASAAADLLTFDVIDPGSVAASNTGALAAGRVGATVTGLGDDTALVWGGNLAAVIDPALAHGERLLGLDASPSTAPLTVVSGTPTLRAFHRAVPVAPGRVLVAGGFAINAGLAHGPAARLAQVIDVDGTNISITNPGGGAAPTPVGYLDAVGLGGGDVLITGGDPPQGTVGCPADELVCATRQALRYAADTSTLEPTGAMIVVRYGHRTAVLADGRVAVTGGLRADERLEVIADAELYDPRDADDDPLADLRPAVVRAAGDVARDAATLDPVRECEVIDLP